MMSHLLNFVRIRFVPLTEQERTLAGHTPTQAGTMSLTNKKKTFSYLNPKHL